MIMTELALVLLPELSTSLDDTFHHLEIVSLVFVWTVEVVVFGPEKLLRVLEPVHE